MTIWAAAVTLPWQNSNPWKDKIVDRPKKTGLHSQEWRIQMRCESVQWCRSCPRLMVTGMWMIWFLAEVGRENAGDVAEIDLALRAIHLEQLPFIQVVVVYDVGVVLQDELIVALLADHLQRLPSPHHIRFPAWAPGSQHAALGSIGADGHHQQEHGNVCQEAHLGGGRHSCGICKNG